MTAHRVPLRVLRLYTEVPYTHTGTQLRGAVLRRYPDREYLHNRRSNGAARLPDIRYLVIDEVPTIVAVGEGRGELLDVYRTMDTLPVPGGAYRVTGSELEDAPVELGLVGQLVPYESATPWLGLNQRNHRAFAETRSETARHELLGRILVGNHLVAMRQLGVELGPTDRILLAVESARWREIDVRGITFLGFRLRLVSNLGWSPLIGVGKQVAKGFGRFVRRGAAIGRGAVGA